MDLTEVSDSSSPGAAAEIVASAPCRSPSLSPSSPDSLSHSVLSSLAADSSLGVNHVRDRPRGKRLLVASSGLSPPSPDITSSDSCRRSSAMQSLVDKQPCRTTDNYDSFHPLSLAKSKGEKYDPFDPTVSPGSEVDERSVKVKSRSDKKRAKKHADSTQSSTGSLLSSAPWWRADGGGGRRRDASDSDHSEIEEGEIVVADRREGIDRAVSPSPFCVSKPERILRVVDGDGLVSVRTEGDDGWPVRGEPDDGPVVGVEDLRNKLLSRQKERFSSLPALTPLPLQPLLLPSHSSAVASSRLSPLDDDGVQNQTFKSSDDGEQQKDGDRKAGERREKKVKRKKDKGGQERSKDKERGKKEDKKTRSRHSSSGATKKKSHNKETSKPAKTSHKKDHKSSSSQYEDRDADRGRSKVKDRTREGYKERERPRERERERERSRDVERRPSRNRSHRRHVGGGPSTSHKDKERKERKHSSSHKAETSSRRSKTSREPRPGRSDGRGEREKRRDGRPVIPPSIQDLSGSDLFAIKRTITVTTTTTTTTAVPGSPPPYARPAQEPSRHRKRKWLSAEDEEVGKEGRRSPSLSPPRFPGYQSQHYDKFEIDVLSLDGEALDSDYQLLDDTPPAGLPPDPEVPAPPVKTAPKATRRHQKKKLKEADQYETSSLSSSKSKTKHLSSLKVTSGSASVPGLSGLTSLKRSRKTRKNKEQDKSSRKDPSRSGKSKKEDGSNRKGKLQSKVSVLVRDGVSSTTGGKPGLDLLGSAGPPGSSVVGDSIAVVFCRDNESRSPFLKPCSEPLASARLAAPLPSLASPAGGLKSKKTKPSSITSTSSSASSSSLVLTAKRCRRPARKTKVKAGVSGSTEDGVNAPTKVSSENWERATSDVQSGTGDANDSTSPRPGQTSVAPGSSSSSSSSSSTSSTTNALAPSSSPQRTPPPADTRTRESSSPDSQTVDSSCKTPETSFLADEGPTQTSPRPPGPAAASPSSSSSVQGGGPVSAPNVRSPPGDQEAKVCSSPSNLSSSTSGDLSTFSALPKTSSEPSASVSSSSVGKPFLPSPFPWNLQTGVDCAAGGVLALTALLFKMEEANIANRAKAHEFLQATNQILSKANQNQNQNQCQQHLPTTPSASSSSSSSSSQVPLPPVLPPPPRLSPAQFILHGSLPLVGCTKTPPSLLQPPSVGGGAVLQTPSSALPLVLPGGSASCGDAGWDGDSKDPDKYLKKLHTQERAVEEVKLAIKPYYQRKDITKDEYKDILRKAVHKICHSRTGEINPVKVSNLVKLYVQRYKYFRKHGRRVDEEDKDDKELLHSSS